MKKFLVRLFVVLGVIYLMTVVLALVIVAGRKGHVPSKTILEADLQHPLVEDIPDTPTSKVMLSDRATVRDVIDAIDRAADNTRVAVLEAKIGSVPMGIAQVQEIRDSAMKFCAKKKCFVACA